MSLKTPSAAINDHEPSLPIIPFGIVAYGFFGQPLSKQLYLDLVTVSIVSAGDVDRVSFLIKVAMSHSLEKESSVNLGNCDATELSC